MGMMIGYLEVVEVKKIRSRNVCQLIVEADISQFKTLVQLDELKGVFIPFEIEGAVCGAMEMDIEPEELRALMSATTKQETTIEQEPKPNKHRSLAQNMMISGYFRNLELWDAMEKIGAYTQKEHKAHIEDMEGLNLYPNQPRKGAVVAHHVRTAANSGTGIKPKHWYCIPLHDSQHKYLHNNATREERHEHLETAVLIMATEVRKAFKRWEGIDTMKGYEYAQLVAAEERLGITTSFTDGTTE